HSCQWALSFLDLALPGGNADAPCCKRPSSPIQAQFHRYLIYYKVQHPSLGDSPSTGGLRTRLSPRPRMSTRMNEHKIVVFTGND
ncbi:MAG: hypothetical protein RSH52_06010, partial [Janthinobacterium sp.]